MSVGAVATPKFERASQDTFFLSIESKDPLFEEDAVRRFLEGTGAVNVSLVGEEEEGDWS